VITVGEALHPGSAAALLVYQNLSATSFASAVRRAGGQFVANGLIPVRAILGAIDQDTEAAAPATQEPLSPRPRWSPTEWDAATTGVTTSAMTAATTARTRRDRRF